VVARRANLRSQATQVGGAGELAVMSEDTAGMVQVELQSAAAKFHVEFEKQARIAELATEKLRNEASHRARMEEQHRRGRAAGPRRSLAAGTPAVLSRP